jgi:hypothetical protein
LYYEKILDPETREVLREVQEPLSEHRGRGDAGPRYVFCGGVDSEVGTGVGTARAFRAPVTHLTHATMAFSHVHAAEEGAYGIRTKLDLITHYRALGIAQSRFCLFA